MKTLRDYVRIYLTGFAMGAADIVPGVSGGTMAFILGIYEILLEGIKSFNFELLRVVLQRQIKQALDMVPWRFLLTLGLGIATAILTLASFLSWMLENEPEYLFAFFFGLILASIVAVGAKIKTWNAPTIAALVGGALVALLIVIQDPASNAGHSLPVLFFSGMIAIMAMILPGISGSFILLLLGQYEYVLNAVKDLDLKVLITVAAGCAVGLVGFSRLLSWLLKHYERLTVATLTGFMIGSLWKIYPFREAAANVNVADHAEEFTKPVMPDFAAQEFWLALGLCIIGFAIVTALDHMQSRANPVVLLFVRRNIPEG